MKLGTKITSFHESTYEAVKLILKSTFSNRGLVNLENQFK